MAGTIIEEAQRLRNNIDAVYEAGKAAGGGSGDSYYDTFWDAFQDNGNRKNYRRGFYDFGYGWDDETYNPKYPIIFTDSGYAANETFANSAITDTKVDIICEGATQLASTFNGATKLKTIRKIVINENVLNSSLFVTCRALENITIEGVIGYDWNLQWSPLTVESMKNIILCLKNFFGTDKANVYTVKFNDECWAALEADSTAPNGGTWQNYVINTLCWNV